MVEFTFAARSEWLKRRRSLTVWLVLGSACFIPSIIFLSRFRRIDELPGVYRNPRFWEILWVQSWEAMALMILPLGVMLLVSLVTQIEDRNNAWKQVHATPLPLITIYFAKLLVILALVVQLAAGFIAAIYVCGILPALIFAHVDRPAASFPLMPFLVRALQFVVDTLPVVALQYLLALRFRTFLAPLALGMGLWMLAIGAMSWKHSYVLPYAATGLDYLTIELQRRLAVPVNLRLIATGYFVVFTIAGYALYATRKDKG